MSESFIGEIRMFAGNFAPRGWAFCDGQLLAVSGNDALFSLLGTNYGGDGRTTFGLPEMRGRIPIHQGSGPGLSPRLLGAKAGQEKVTLTVNQLAAHTHSAQCTDGAGTSNSPQGNIWAGVAAGVAYSSDPPVTSSTPLAAKADAISVAGESQSHTNLQPFVCVNFIISLVGIFPSRN